jgi:hypothetical protein
MKNTLTRIFTDFLHRFSRILSVRICSFIRVYPCILALILICLILPQPAQAATYYVDINGVGEDGILGTADDVISSDSNPGTAEQPWKTMAYAAAHATNGSTVYLRNGDYGYITIDGSIARTTTGWGDCVTFTPDSGASPTIDQLTIQKEKYGLKRTPSGLIFSGLTIAYPDPNGVIPSGQHVVYIKQANYVKIQDCNIVGVHHQYQDASGLPDSTTYNIQIGSATSGVNYVTIEDCNIYNSGCFGIADIGENDSYVTIKNNYVHDTAASPIEISGTKLTPVIIEGNHIFKQNPAWYTNGVKTASSHGSGIYLSTGNVIIRGNTIHSCGNTAATQGYMWVQDGSVAVGGSWADPNYKFTNGEAVTQETTGAKGWYDRISGSTVYILRNQEENLFTAAYNIVSDSNPSKVWKPASIGTVRPYGGYSNVTIENNLYYDTLNNIYKIIFYDVGSNFKFNNNTVIGNTYAGRSGGQYYQTTLSFSNFAHGSDANTVEVCNNIFVGCFSPGVVTDIDSLAPFKTGLKVKGNIFYSLPYRDHEGATTSLNPLKYRNQTWFDEHFPGNKVYNWNQGNQGQYEFGTSGVIFKGGSLFDTYSYTRGSDGTSPHYIDLGDSYTLAQNSTAPPPAIIYGDVNGDGEISAYDAALTAQVAVDLITLTPEQTKAADVNSDREVTAYDAALIAQRAVGLIDKFPVE